jgi:uncharacterized protein (TIGR02391 family)
MAAIPVFTDPQLEQLCAVVADTSEGLTGAEIGRLLAECGIADPHPGVTKRHRLFAALQQRQLQDVCSNHVIAFLQRALDPVRYTRNPETFDNRREEINVVLRFCGYEIGEDGKFRQTVATKTLTEAEERAGRLRTELRRRQVHPDVLSFCRAELLQRNYFHAVFEATKSVADKIRSRTGLYKDGSELVDMAFGSGGAGMPFLAFNALQTDTERSEHSGIMNLMKGMFGTFRNVTAHAPKVLWSMTEQDALDLLTIASFVHRRLDAAVRTPRKA